MKVKSRSHLEKNDLAGLANLIITKIWFYDNLYVFEGEESIFDISYWATMFRWPRKSRSTSGTGGTWRYWWLCLTDFWNFFTIYVFEGEESISDIPIELPCIRWPRKSRSTSGTGGTCRYWWLCLMDSRNFFTIYVFEGEESIADIPIELPCFGDLENPGQLPVQEVLAGTDDCVSWIFEISSLFMFSRVRNPFPIFLLSYHASVTSKIQVNFRYRRYLQVLMIVSHGFLKCSSLFMFSRSRNPLLTFLLSYHVRVISKIQVNFRYRRYSKVLMILCYKFSKFLQYSCFRGQEIHCWHFYWATVFGWPWKSRSTSGTGGTDDSVLWIFEISSIFMFPRSRNPLLAFLLSYPVRVTLEIQVNFRYRGTRRYWWSCLMNFRHYLHYLCLRGQATEYWHFYRATMFGWPQKSRSTSGSGGTDDSVSWIFEIPLLFMFSRSMNPLLIFLLSYLVWVTSKTSRTGSTFEYLCTGSWLGFPR